MTIRAPRLGLGEAVCTGRLASERHEVEPPVSFTEEGGRPFDTNDLS